MRGKASLLVFFLILLSLSTIFSTGKINTTVRVENNNHEAVAGANGEIDWQTYVEIDSPIAIDDEFEVKWRIMVSNWKGEYTELIEFVYFHVGILPDSLNDWTNTLNRTDVYTYAPNKPSESDIGAHSGTTKLKVSSVSFPLAKGDSKTLWLGLYLQLGLCDHSGNNIETKRIKSSGEIIIVNPRVTSAIIPTTTTTTTISQIQTPVNFTAILKPPADTTKTNFTIGFSPLSRTPFDSPGFELLAISAIIYLFIRREK